MADEGRRRKRRVSQREQARRSQQSRHDTPQRPEDVLAANLQRVRLMRALGVSMPPLRPYGGLFGSERSSGDGG